VFGFRERSLFILETILLNSSADSFVTNGARRRVSTAAASVVSMRSYAAVILSMINFNPNIKFKLFTPHDRPTLFNA
jgi:hypothetical protein